jgi:hypothetical protein
MKKCLAFGKNLASEFRKKSLFFSRVWPNLSIRQKSRDL